MAAMALVLSGCVSSQDTASTVLDHVELQASAPLAPSAAIPTTPTTAAPPTRPGWLGSRPLDILPDGSVEPQSTPPELLQRAFPTEDSLPAPPSDAFASTVSAFEGEPLARSTYGDDCPVPADDLRYLTMTFWGFDGLHHTGEMVVHADWADQVVSVFAALDAARFPIEEMRLVTPADLENPPTGDTNNTTAYVCRAVTGGTRWSDHALGTAIDINPFHNPYGSGDLVLPELAAAYLDRGVVEPGMVMSDGVVVEAFTEIGWQWGGNWRTLKDYQHFSVSGR